MTNRKTACRTNRQISTVQTSKYRTDNIDTNTYSDRQTNSTNKPIPHILTHRQRGKQTVRSCHIDIDRQMDRRSNRKTDRQTDRPTDRQAGRQTGREEDKKTAERTDGQTDTDKQTGRQTDR